MYVYVCVDENNFLKCCSITYFVSGETSTPQGIDARVFNDLHSQSK